MSSHTGLVVNNMDRFMERAFVAELGYPTPDMSDFDQYPSDAIVPLELRPFTVSDLEWFEKEMRATDITPPLGRITIVRPRDLRSTQLHELQQFAANNHPDTKSSHLEPDRTRALTIDIPSNLWKPYGTAEPFAVNKLRKRVPNYLVTPNEAGVRTATQLPDTENPLIGNPRIGMHFDRWFRSKTAEECLQAPNRFGLNLGPGERGILLGGDVFDVMSELPLPLESDGHFGLAHVRQYAGEHLRRGDRLRALGIILEEGDGYIVPTEGKLHDGFTRATKHLQETGLVNLPSQVAMWIGNYVVDVEFDRHFEILT